MSYEREGISPQIIDWLTVTQEIFDNFQLLYRYYDYYSEICTGLPTVDNDKQYNILIFDDLDEDLSIIRFTSIGSLYDLTEKGQDMNVHD